jgi:hypothetical protein
MFVMADWKHVCSEFPMNYYPLFSIYGHVNVRYASAEALAKRLLNSFLKKKVSFRNMRASTEEQARVML